MILATLGAALFFAASNALAAVTISSFTAKWQGAQVAVNWVTTSELSNAGFYLWRSTAENGTYAKVSANLIPAKNIGQTTGNQYDFADAPAPAGQTYYYKLQSVDLGGTTSYYSRIAVANASATATPTSTQVPPTGTRTTTSQPSSTPTRTQTVPPGVTPPTATMTFTPQPTSTPQPTPTRTQTYPPGIKPPTAAPSATPTTQRVAVVPVVPMLTSNPVIPTVSNRTLMESSSSQDALPESDSSNEIPAAVESPAGQTMLFRVAMIFVAGALGLGAFVFGALAVFLFMRSSRNGS